MKTHQLEWYIVNCKKYPRKLIAVPFSIIWLKKWPNNCKSSWKSGKSWNNLRQNIKYYPVICIWKKYHVQGLNNWARFYLLIVKHFYLYIFIFMFILSKWLKLSIAIVTIIQFSLILLQNIKKKFIQLNNYKTARTFQWKISCYQFYFD